MALLMLMPLGLVQAQWDDPTLPPSFSALVTEDVEENNAWLLSSVLIAPERRIAIINGKSVRVGDQLDGAIIESIDASSVKLSQRGEIIILELFPITVKTVSEK